jgi:hypothetical protein
VVRKIGVPNPTTPKVIGRLWAAATSSCAVWMFLAGAITSTLGKLPSGAIGTKSFTAS